eukprot:6939913-Alexandrium_andersonii.AAC.1
MCGVDVVVGGMGLEGGVGIPVGDLDGVGSDGSGVFVHGVGRSRLGAEPAGDSERLRGSVDAFVFWSLAVVFPSSVQPCSARS